MEAASVPGCWTGFANEETGKGRMAKALAHKIHFAYRTQSALKFEYAGCDRSGVGACFASDVHGTPCGSAKRGGTGRAWVEKDGVSHAWLLFHFMRLVTVYWP